MSFFFQVQLLFSLWMLVDCYRRGGALYWYPIILLPFGELVYLVQVKLADPLEAAAGAVPRATALLEALRSEAKRTPSFANRLRLGQALHDHRRFGEALEVFEATHALDPTSNEARYGLALCLSEADRPQSAISHLEHIVDAHPAYADYAAWRALIAALVQTGDSDAAIEEARALEHASPALGHSVLLAERLQADAQHAEARNVLKRALEAYASSPEYVQRGQADACTDALSLLESIPRPERTARGHETS